MTGSLLMDGDNENPEINLKKVMFWPDNIVQLFEKYEVRREFDLLSVDMDSYDWWILEKILEAGYRPRVISKFEHCTDNRLNCLILLCFQ